MAVQSPRRGYTEYAAERVQPGPGYRLECAPLFTPGLVRDTLDLSAALIPHALINMGYGAKDPPRRPHRPIGELILRYD